MVVRPTIVCMTPIRNESWILKRFLSCASMWADHIIIADQASDDGSREIALSFGKVTLVENPSSVLNESARQRVLINAARQIASPRLLVALDADEVLTANFIGSPEWDTVLRTVPGTIIQFEWINLLPDMHRCWRPGVHFAWAFMDDGSEHRGDLIHGNRLPVPATAARLLLRDICVLHYQYTDWDRMASKHRWYQCWERLNRPWRRPSDIYRQYHHMYGVRPSEYQEVRREWFTGYRDRGIDMTSTVRDGVYWWDREVLAMLEEHGAEVFRREDIWNVDWMELGHKVGRDVPGVKARDPRRMPDRLVHGWLRRTQPFANTRVGRAMDKPLRLLGW